MANFGEQPTSSNREKFSSNKESANDIKGQLEEALKSGNYAEVAKLGGQMDALKGQEEKFIDADRDEAEAENAERNSKVEQTGEDVTMEKIGEKEDAFGKDIERGKIEDDKKISEIKSQINSMEADVKIDAVVEGEVPRKKFETAILSIEDSEEKEIAKDILDDHGEVAKAMVEGNYSLKEKIIKNGSVDMMNDFVVNGEDVDFVKIDRMHNAIKDVERQNNSKAKIKAIVGGFISGISGVAGGLSLGYAGYIGLATVAPWAGIGGAAAFGVWGLYKKFKNEKIANKRLKSVKDIFTLKNNI